MDESVTTDTSTTVDIPVESTATDDWRASLPEDLRDNATLKNYSDVAALAKSHVHAQKMIGAEKIPLPGKDATDADWEGVYNRLGRPATPDEYKLPEGVFPEGVELDSTLTKTYLEKFHQAGLTQRQTEAVMRSHGEIVKGIIEQQEQASKEALDMGRSTLRKEWGRAYDQNLELARKTVREFGTPDLQSRFTDDSLLRDPEVTRMLATLGEHMQGDIGMGTAHSDASAMTPEQAQNKINELMRDSEFQLARANPGHPTHQQAKEKWTRLHQYAYPEN